MFKSLIITAGALVALAIPSAALANAPDGSYTIAPKANDNASLVGKDSSQITQNGQFVSGKYTALDGWQNQKGDRSAEVQALLGH